MRLARILYRSDSELTGSDRAVREAAFALAAHAAERNAADRVTGALMFVGGVFVQLLEGAPADVERVFERICRDLRHRRLVVLDYSETDERLFEAWAMVAFEGDARARELFPGVSEATPFARRNPLSANRAVEMMRALLATREAEAGDRSGACPTPTGVPPRTDPFDERAVEAAAASGRAGTPAR